MNWKFLEEMQINSPGELKVFFNKYATSWGKKTIVLLAGDLSAGKTEFVKKFLEHVNLVGATSPTFALHNQYGATIQHWDLYRVKDEDDLESTGFWDQFSNENNLVFVEWPEKIQDNLPESWQVFLVKFSVISSTVRKLSVYLRDL